VAADSVQLSLNGLAGVRFTAASIATSASAPYLYVTSGTTLGAALVDPSTYPFPNTSFVASDAEFAAPGYRTVAPGNTFGLVHVLYTVAPGTAPQTGSISIGGITSLSDDQFNLIGFQAVNGSFSVVPEPSSLILAAIGAGSGLLVMEALKRHSILSHGARTEPRPPIDL
jgi:hypothetical protein